MPTGYTHELMKKGLTFKTFALRCARAFGACVMQREDPMDEPPKLAGPSDYHLKAIAAAKEKLAELHGMTPEKQTAYGAKLREADVESARQSLAKASAENERLDSMATQVSAWLPPTNDHSGLKDFMLDQIKISRNSDWAFRWLAEKEAKSPESYFIEAVSSAVKDIAYHEEEHRKEVERTNTRNEWITTLQKSLP